MADEQAPAETQVDTAPIKINAQYIKDLSFEVPNSPSVFVEMQQNSPDINIDITVNASQLHESTFEVSLGVNASCKVGEDTGFILELDYSGAFTLNVPDEHRQAVLMIECPRLLFPFARNIIADVTRDGGFPPVMLGMVDFVAMYQRQVEAQGATSGEPAGDDA